MHGEAVLGTPTVVGTLTLPTILHPFLVSADGHLSSVLAVFAHDGFAD